jgi:serine/threonine-protein kinase HipA
MMNAQGKWQLAPAYDLTFSNSSHGYHSTMVSGESAQPSKLHLMQLADYFKIKKAKVIIEQVEDAVSCWTDFAKEAGVAKESDSLIQKKIQRILKS